MPAALPIADPAPADGALPAQALAGANARGLGFYLHVPFCAVRCGYCDFATWTAAELGGGADRDQYAVTAISEIELAARVLADAARPVATVFFGGGTPTLLPTADLIAMLHAVRDRFGLVEGAEVSIEANPDSVTPQSLEELAAAGVSRVSFGMQSAVPHVLATLDRTHDPRRIPEVVAWARAAGLSVSLDLIYGTPGESLADWQTSLDTALACAPDHLSAYALVVEAGTALAGRVRRGELPLPDDDDQATKYVMADDAATAAGLGWYEVSNWARTPADACRHNLAYWRGDDWWGVGPGAHSHVGGVRWWNVRHPRPYAQALDEQRSPAAGREVLDPAAREVEAVMLGVRIAAGLPVAVIPASGRAALPGLVTDGLIEATPQDVVVLTRPGRLVADAVTRRLLGWDPATA